MSMPGGQFDPNKPFPQPGMGMSAPQFKPLAAPSFTSPNGGVAPSMQFQPQQPRPAQGAPGQPMQFQPQQPQMMQPGNFAPQQPRPLQQPMQMQPMQPMQQMQPVQPMSTMNAPAPSPLPMNKPLQAPAFNVPSFTPKPMQTLPLSPNMPQMPTMPNMNTPPMSTTSQMPQMQNYPLKTGPSLTGMPMSKPDQGAVSSGLSAPVFNAPKFTPLQNTFQPLHTQGMPPPPMMNMPPPPQQQQLQQQQPLNTGFGMDAQQGFPPQNQNQNQGLPSMPNMPNMGGNNMNMGLPPPMNPNQMNQNQNPMMNQGDMSSMQMPSMQMPSMLTSPMGNMPQDMHSQPSQPVIPSHAIPIKETFMSSSCKVFPATTSLHVNSHLPQGIILRPLADPDAGPVPVTDFNRSGVLRCLKCRAYVSAYCPFLDNGSAWRCCFCSATNNVPDTYYAPLDAKGLRTDLNMRPELQQSSYEVFATADYAVRQPMPPTYFFVIDVSMNAQRSGMLKSVAETIEKCLDQLPGGSSDSTPDAAKRVRVGFLTFDSAVHMYEMRPTAAGPHMYVQANLDNIIVPVPSGLVVNLIECRTQISAFLEALPDMHAQSEDPEVAVGPALTTAVELVRSLGGKICLFTSGLPSIGRGRLINRDNKKAAAPGVDNEGFAYYDALAKIMTKHQICTDLFFITHDNFVDVTTLSALSTQTSGQLHHFQHFHPVLHSEKLSSTLSRVLTRLTGWEAVLRMRVSPGATVSDFYGNFTIRNNALLSLPNVDSDKTFGFEVCPDDNIMTDRCVYAQAALLYTNYSGERRIRVHTMCIPATQSLTELYDSVNVNCTMNLLAKQSTVMALTSPDNLSRARQHLMNRCLNILRTYRSVMNKPNYDYGPLSALSVMCLGLLKSVAFRDAPDVKLDRRVASLLQLLIMGLLELETYVRPRLLDVTSLTGDVGVSNADGIITLPVELSATEANLTTTGVFLMDNGVDMVLRVGQSADPAYITELFGHPSLYQLHPHQLVLRPASGNPADTSPCQRLHNIVDTLRRASCQFQVLRVVREGEPVDSTVQAMFIEDAQANVLSLAQMASLVHKG